MSRLVSRGRDRTADFVPHLRPLPEGPARRPVPQCTPQCSCPSRTGVGAPAGGPRSRPRGEAAAPSGRRRRLTRHRGRGPSARVTGTSCRSGRTTRREACRAGPCSCTPRMREGRHWSGTAADAARADGGPASGGGGIHGAIAWVSPLWTSASRPRSSALAPHPEGSTHEGGWISRVRDRCQPRAR